MIELLKAVAGALTGPLNAALLLCAIALLLRWRRRPRAARWLAICAAALVYVFSTQPVADLLMSSLENRYAPLATAALPAPRYVAVLGSGYAPRGAVPVTGALDRDGLARVVEGVRLARLWPQATLILSGGAPQDRAKPARGYEVLARELGVDPARVMVLDQPTNTAAEATAIATVVKSDSVVLVTSAFHMPRAMREMQRRGLQPLAAPTAQRYDAEIDYGFASLLPGADALRRSEHALHEYLALLATALGVGA